MTMFRPGGASSSSASGVNFILTPDAESGSTGWATYADVAGATPVDGTGGAPTVTWTISSTSPLMGSGSFVFTKDAANRQGEGSSYDFTIDSGYQAKVLSIEFDYIVGSGTFVGGATGVDSDVEIYIYDVTNAVVIQPSTYKLYSNSSTASAHFVGNFQSASNSTSYRLIFHTATTSASAYTLKFDTISVSPSKYVYGTPITDWTSFTPTGAWSANTTYTGYWRRVGDSMEAQTLVTVSGAPTSATLTINLPTGYTIDTTKLVLASSRNQVLGKAAARDDSAASVFPGNAVYNNTTSVRIDTVTASNSTLLAVTTQAAPFTFANLDTVHVEYRLPIVGWSSTVQMSDSADQRVVAAIISGDPASATSGNPIIVPTVGYDSHGAYSNSTGRYTVPVPGIYKIFGALLSASSATTLTIFKNAVSTALAGNLDSNGEATFAGAVNCVGGDIIDLRPGGTVDATSMTLNIERTSGPSAIGATELVAARYYSSTTAPGTVGSPTAIAFATKDFDTHSAYSGTTFTAPIAGKYMVNAGTYQTASTTAANQAVDTYINKNGVIVSGNENYFTSSTSKPISTAVSDVIAVVAGDTISISAGNAGTTPAMGVSNTRNYVSIYRIGL